MSELREFRRKRAVDELVESAVAWVRADREWRDYDPFSPGGTPAEDERLYSVSKRARERFERSAATVERES